MSYTVDDADRYICYRSAKATKYSFPFSCCNLRSERPCINVDVNNADAHYKYSPTTDVTVYRIGCNLGVTRVLREVILDNLRYYGWIAFLFEVATEEHCFFYLIYFYLGMLSDILLSSSVTF